MSRLKQQAFSLAPAILQGVISMKKLFGLSGVVGVGMFVLLVGTASLALAQNSAPIVTNVSAQQVDGTGLVRITFDVSDADSDSVTAVVICSSNNGQTFDLLPVSVSGDVHRPIVASPGKQIIWNATADYPGRDWTRVVAKVLVSDGPSAAVEMVYVPAGNFTMGSTVFLDEQPVHSVYLDAFYIDKHEVTNGQFEAFINAGGYSTQAFWSAEGWSWRTDKNVTRPRWWDLGSFHAGPGWPEFPVVGVSWYEAEAYANFVGKRLPMEAEWEKAARGTDARTYPWGEGIDGSRANYLSSGDPYDDGSTPAGFYDGRLLPSPPLQTTNSPGPYGAYDQAGNVWEWVHDWYSLTYCVDSLQSNPPGPLTGTCRVLRGGGWVNHTTNLRCTKRNNNDPVSRYKYYGFRCARTQ